MNRFSHIYLNMPLGDGADNARYIQSLCSEIERLGRSIDRSLLASIYIAGAVDSWPEEGVLDTSGTLVRMFDFNDSTEFTIEITGKSTTSSQHSCWQKSGVNRISIGTTHFKDTMQKADFDTALKNYSVCLSQVSSVCKNINVDVEMSAALSFVQWKRLVSHVAALPITHISLYAQEVMLDIPVAWYEWAIDYLHSVGFEQYEFSHFAKPGYRSEYLQACWQHQPYKGFGAGACSFDGQTRYGNESNRDRYVECIMNEMSPIVFHETLTEKEMCLEKLLVGLRTKEGVRLHEIIKDLTQTQQDIFLNKISVLKKKKLVQEHNGMLSLTVQGMMLENQIIVDLITVYN